MRGKGFQSQSAHGFDVNEAERLFPGTIRNSTNELYTTFTGDKEGFQPAQIGFKADNPDLIKIYYNRQINFYFRTIQKQIVKVGFVKENQVWMRLKVLQL